MSAWRVKRAVRVILAGGIIAYPTEAVYGLGCSPYDVRAGMRLLEIKRRNPARGLILIGGHLSDFADFIQPPERVIKDRIMPTWPGPVTWLLPASTDCPAWLRGDHRSIAVRVTAHPLCRRLCKESGMALVSTSANRHGKPAALTAAQVRWHLPGEPDYILAGPTSGEKRPSEIRDALTARRIR